jgi:hypothetical protein
MDDAHGYEERVDEGDAGQISASGDYLCVQHEGQLRYIYRRVPEGAALPPLVSRAVHGGALYSLAWIEGDE